MLNLKIKTFSLLVLLASSLVFKPSLAVDEVYYVKLNLNENRLDIKITTPPEQIKYLDPNSVYDKRRDSQGDRLSSFRDYWPKRINDFTDLYPKECRLLHPNIGQKNEFTITLNLLDTTDITGVSLLACLSHNWAIKYTLLKELQRSKIEDTLKSYFNLQSSRFQKLFLNNLLDKNSNLYSQISSLFYDCARGFDYLYPAKNFDMAINIGKHKINKDVYTDVILEQALMITHATLKYDYNALTKRAIDKIVLDAKNRNIPVIYLMDEDKDHLWFTQDRDPNYALFSRWGEHNYTVKNEITIVGGQWNNCFRVSIVDAITRHFANFPNIDIKINLPMDGIYSENDKLMSTIWRDLDEALWDSFIERNSIFQGWEIEIDDPHEGVMVIENDMNKYTGVPNISEYGYSVSINSKLQMRSYDYNNGLNLKKIHFNLIFDE